jgi:CPA2 family monovalent cation:H+ antiporter-2
MHANEILFRDIALVYTFAFVMGLLFWRLKQPLILGYVLAGLILNPLTPGIRIHDVHTFEVMAEVGVILLMFSSGIEFSIPELRKMKAIALFGAPLGILLCIGLGIGVGELLHWPFMQCLAVGCIISVASTMVLMRFLIDRGEMTTQAGRVMVTLTLIEDVVVVMLTSILPALGAEGSGHYGDVLWKVGKALLLLVPVGLVGWKLIPKLLKRVEKVGNRELSLLVALTVCLAVAAITEGIGLSLALGAFVGGMLLGSSDYAHKLIDQLYPIQTAFVALFFVTIGMIIDPPRTWLADWQTILVLVLMILVGKFVIWSLVVKLCRYSTKTSLRVGIGLTQIGEFSFVLAQVSLQAGLISRNVYNATLAASLITILANATILRFVKQTPTAANERGTLAHAVPQPLH